MIEILPNTDWEAKPKAESLGPSADELQEMFDTQPADSRVVVQAYLPHLKNYFDGQIDPLRDLVYSWPGGPLAVGDIVLCPQTPRGPGPFEALVVSLDGADHPYKGPVKSIIKKVSP